MRAEILDAVLKCDGPPCELLALAHADARRTLKTRAEVSSATDFGDGVPYELTRWCQVRFHISMVGSRIYVSFRGYRF